MGNDCNRQKIQLRKNLRLTNCLSEGICYTMSIENQNFEAAKSESHETSLGQTFL